MSAWPRVDRARMSELYRSGSTKLEIALVFGVTENAIHRYLVKDGLREPSYRRAGKVICEARVRELAKAGKSATEIAGEMDLHVATISKFARQRRIRLVRGRSGPAPKNVAAEVETSAEIVELKAASRFYRPAFDWADIPMSRSAA